MSQVFQTSPYPKNEDPTPQMQGHLRNNGSGADPTTLGELLELCTVWNLDPDEVKISGGHTKWISLETPEEAEARVARWQSHLAWIEDGARKQYEKLKERFENEDAKI